MLGIHFWTVNTAPGAFLGVVNGNVELLSLKSKNSIGMTLLFNQFYNSEHFDARKQDALSRIYLKLMWNNQGYS